MMFIPNEHLVDAVENNNITRIRSAFTTIAYEDPTFTSGKFTDSLEYVKSKNVSGVFTEFDQRAFKSKEEWNEDYWSEIVASLMNDFSYERINHLKEISQYLYPVNRKRTSGTSDESGNQNRNRNTTTETKYGVKSKKVIPIAVTAGFAVTSLAAIVVGAKGIAAVTGVIAIGTAVYTIQRE